MTPDEAVRLTAQEWKEAQEQKPQLEALLGSRGWDILRRFAEAQIEARTQEVMSSPTGRGKSAAELEFLKGEASGIRVFLAIPALVLEGFDFTLEGKTNGAPVDDTPSGDAAGSGDDFSFGSSPE